MKPGIETASMLAMWCALALTALGAARASGAMPPELVVTPAAQAVITVDAGKVVRPQLPDTLFGFNIRWNNFETDLWQAARHRVHPAVTSALQPFVGAVYRYPGGTVANSYDWEAARQPLDVRTTLNRRLSRRDALPLFGIDEYLGFVTEVGGTPLYTLNLLGRESGRDITEYPASRLAASNRRLAEYMKQRLAPRGISRIYQLGNELDRGTTEWSHRKYISRALETMTAMREVDPDARFMAFVRDFNWRYRLPGHVGTSRYDEFIREVLQGLPAAQDLSLNIYYDGAWRRGAKFLAMDEVMEKQETVLEIARSVRPDRATELWVTEHARVIGAVDENPGGRDKTLASNLGGALSSADFLLGLAQIPEARGASWHSLNGVDRRLFEPGPEPQPTAIYWAFRVLRTVPSGAAVLSTRTASPNFSGYPGGYDIRAVAMKSERDGSLTVWVINRAGRTTAATLQVAGWQDRKVTLRHYYVAGSEGMSADQVGSNYRRDLDPQTQAAQFSPDGSLTVKLPPASVSSFVITAAK